MERASIQQQFKAALDRLVEQIKEDRSVLAAILCGSLSHDTVWAKSDIDLVLVTIDDKKVAPSDLALYADGVNVHAILIPRAEFRKTVEGSIDNSFVHSLLAKGGLLYTHDETIAGLFAGLSAILDPMAGTRVGKSSWPARQKTWPRARRRTPGGFSRRTFGSEEDET